MHAHGLAVDDMVEGADPVPSESRPQRRRLRGMAQLTEGVRAAQGVAEPAQAAPAAPVLRRRLREAVQDQCRAFMQGDALSADPLAWWADEGRRNFKYLYPGAVHLEPVFFSPFTVLISPLSFFNPYFYFVFYFSLNVFLSNFVSFPSSIHIVLRKMRRIRQIRKWKNEKNKKNGKKET